MTTVLVLVVAAVLIGGAACIAIAAPSRRAAVPSRALVLILIGLVVGELVSVLVLTGPIDTELRTDAERAAPSAPAVRAAQTDLDAATSVRAALDTTVAEATTRRDQALVVARCEYRPGAACPQTTITGVPGQGPETHTANQRLAAAQVDVDRATADRAARTPAADALVARAGADVESARDVVLTADRGVGDRWIVMNGLSLQATALRIAIDLLCVALALLPLLLRLWRGETVQDIRHSRLLESERIAAAAQLAIDRRAQERRVELALASDQPTQLLPSVAAGAAALQAAGFEPVAVSARRYVKETSAMNDDFLPIAAAAEAASLRATGRHGRDEHRQPAPDDTPTGYIPVVVGELEPDEPEEIDVTDPRNLPAVRARAVPAVPVPAAPAVRETSMERKPNPYLPPVLDDAARTLDGAARTVLGFVRPFVPPVVARVLPGPGVRTTQESYEEVEEVTFSMRRTRKVNSATTERFDDSTGERAREHS